ncbi:MAG: phage portal protein [Planctomycetes bacterium]|nr:phage portal protein [Planctomycetota bacterium]
MSIKETIGKALVSVTAKAFGVSGLAQMWDSGGEIGGKKDSSKADKPYGQVGLVYSCVNTLVDGILGLPAAISTLDDRIVESGPAYDLLFSNPAMSWGNFITQSIGHYALSRDVFWIFTETEGIRPTEILVVSGTQMLPITDDRRASGNLIGWEFRGVNGERAVFGTEEVHQWKNFNPYSKFHGLGPTTAAELSINYSYASSLFNMSALENGAELGLILSTEQKLEKDQIQLLRSQIDSRHRGASKAKRTAILTGGLKAESIAMNMANMEMAKISQMSDVRLCSAFGVPPECVGIVTEAQYAQGPAQRDLIFNTIIPMARQFAGEISHGILARHYTGEQRAVELKDCRMLADRSRPLHKRKSYRSSHVRAIAEQDKMFVWFDTDQHPTVQEAQRNSTEKILSFVEKGIPLNDLIDAHDLPYEHVDWGDDWWIGMGQVPARLAMEAGLEGITGPSAPEGQPDPAADEDNKKSAVINTIEDTEAMIKQLIAAEQKAGDDEQLKLRIWRKWIVSWAGLEKEYKEAMRRTFVRQQRILSKKLKDAFDDSKSVTKDAREIITRVVFDLKFENDKIKVINQAFFDKASELGIRQSLTEIAGMAGDELDQVVEDVKRRTAIRTALTRSSHKLIKINQFTQKKVAAQLTAGLENGEGLNDLTDRIRELFTGKMGRDRALRIARSQTATAVGAGRHEGMKQAGVERKGWLSSRDDHVRPAHRSAEQQYKGGIPVDQPFNVGGEMLMYPADPAGSAANIINCRCLQIAVAAKGKAFDLKFYANVKFYSYDDMNKAG